MSTYVIPQYVSAEICDVLVENLDDKINDFDSGSPNILNVDQIFTNLIENLYNTLNEFNKEEMQVHVDTFESVYALRYEKGHSWPMHRDTNGHGLVIDTLPKTQQEICLVNGCEFSEDGVLHSKFSHKRFSHCRKISLILQISKPDTYKGGDLHFFEKDFDVMSDEESKIETDNIRQQGTLILHNSYDWHETLPVEDGVRYSIVTRAIGYNYS